MSLEYEYGVLVSVLIPNLTPMRILVFENDRADRIAAKTRSQFGGK